ncbi:MAG: 16S rRNA (cytidine(1402)-2'-O)-methyltransferase [Actinomycetes bacterium]|jgi:16S rRNA (cytidine1402-2'-O)-methyltransferase|nr:16S rRNA (cytidine(1402)-2'-O)-methyltransferase [Acidimicrobiia bacterium]
MPGRLFLCATPIGNLEDASPRLARTLREADVIYAEDTRRTAKLLAALGVTGELRSYFVGNERRRTADIAADLAAGRDVALVTDAGSPAVSDPGASAVEAARRVQAEVVVVPGPSAVVAAVMGSGMVDGRFVFEGFLERRGRDRSRQLERIATGDAPTVLFLSPHRAAADAEALAEACGEDRRVCVARELTKMHEELWWGTLGELVDKWRQDPPRGELTLVVAEAEEPEPDLERALEIARRLVSAGEPASAAAREAAEATGVPRRQIYDRLVR